MSFRHGKTTVVLVGEHDLSAWLNDSSVSDETEANETTTYGLGAKRYQPGLEDVSVSMSGLFDGVQDAVDDVLTTALKSDALVPLLVVSDSPAAIGNRCVFLDSVHTSYETTNPVADVVGVSAEFQGSRGSAHGLLLTSLTPVDATATLDSVDGGDYTSSRGLIKVHVLANDRDDDTTLQVEESADDTTFAPFGDPLVIPAGTTGVFTIEVDGTVERYLRLDVTLAGTTGSATILAAAARL